MKLRSRIAIFLNDFKHRKDRAKRAAILEKESLPPVVYPLQMLRLILDGKIILPCQEGVEPRAGGHILLRQPMLPPNIEMMRCLGRGTSETSSARKELIQSDTELSWHCPPNIAPIPCATCPLCYAPNHRTLPPLPAPSTPKQEQERIRRIFLSSWQKLLRRIFLP